MSRESESPGEFALVGAGPVAASLAGVFARIPGALGPVVGVSYRVASRIANSLGTGKPARNAGVLQSSSLLLIHAPPRQMKALAEMLGEALLQWKGKSLIFVDCEPGPMAAFPFSEASFAWVQRCPIPGRLAVGGKGNALVAASRLASTIDRHPIVVPFGVKQRFDAAMMLGGAALTPLIDSVAHILRETGMMDKQAAQTAVALFQNAVQGYARSGRQSWEWHVHDPDIESIESRIDALGGAEAPILRDLLLLGFKRFHRHTAAALRLREQTAPHD